MIMTDWETKLVMDMFHLSLFGTLNMDTKQFTYQVMHTDECECRVKSELCINAAVTLINFDSIKQ
jgi:hypothetical protein